MTNKLYFGAALALLLTGCIRETAPEAAPERPSEPMIFRDVTPSMQAVVEFDDQMISLIESDLEEGNFLRTKSDGLNSRLMDLGVVQMERVFPHAGEFEERTRRDGLHRFYHIVMAEEEATKAQVSLAGMPGVLSVEPVSPIMLRSYFDDPFLSDQWHLVNQKQQDVDIHVQEVWEKYTVGSSQVVVSVVDEPVDPTHPDLQDNLWKDADGHTGYNFVRSSYDLSIRVEQSGDEGHGTHVAGVIAAVNNNGIGVSSIAGGDKARGIGGVRLQSCAIFSGDKSSTDMATVRAIKWGADHGAVISQNSWGIVADLNGDDIVSASELNTFKNKSISGSMKKAVDYFIEHAGCDNDGNQLPDSPMKGGLVLFACGNDNIDYDVISSYEPIISVGATNKNGKRSYYSNYGEYVDLAAPGGANPNWIWSTLPKEVSNGKGRKITTNGYGGSGWAGTSMACPHASGVAALLVSYFGGPGFTAEQCKEYLLKGAGEAVGGSTPIGRRLDALGAFEYGLAHHGGAIQRPPVIYLETSSIDLSSDETVTVNLTVSDPDGDAVTVSCEPGSAALTYNDQKRQATIVGNKAANGTYKAVFTARDEGGLTASATLNYTISTNHAPVIELEKDEVTVDYYETVQIRFSVSDPDGDEISTSCSTGSKALKLDRENSLIIITGSGATDGSYKATLSASDGKLTTRATLIYTLLPKNQAPEIVVDPTEITVRGSQTAEAQLTWSDPDGDVLTITCTPGSEAVSFDKDSGKVTIQGAKAEAGHYKAVFLATDPDGAEAKAELFYTILENHPPVILADKNQFTLNPLQSATAQVSWSDEDGDAVTVSCTPGSAALSFDKSSGLVTIQGDKADPGTYKAVFTATDALGLSASTEISYTLLQNHAPQVSVSPSTVTLRSVESAQAQVSWSDQDDWDELTVDCTPGSPALSFNSTSGKVTIQGGKAPAGSYQARFTVTDLGGATATAVLDYSIQENHAPEILKTLDDLLIQGIGQSADVSLDGVFRDPDGDQPVLGAHVSEGADVVKAVLSGQKVTLTSTKAGVATVTVEAKDAAGESCSTSFRVSVKTSDKAVDVYPQPAQDYVYFQIASPTEEQVSITFYTATGSRALQFTAPGSVFKPIQVDITSLAPGRYSSELSYGGQTYKSQIIVK